MILATKRIYTAGDKIQIENFFLVLASKCDFLHKDECTNFFKRSEDMIVVPGRSWQRSNIIVMTKQLWALK